MQIKRQISGWLRHCAIVALGALLATSAVGATDVTTYFHNDISGTPMLATNATGQVVWKETYRPYGQKLTNSAAATGNKVGYTGKPFDNNTGLSYMGARYYDPVLGRFTGIDPKEVDPNDLHSFNRYAYANNNPYKYVDPDGRSPLLVLLPVVGWTAGGAATAGGINAAWQLANSGQVRWQGVGGVIDAAGDGAILGPMFAGIAARSAGSSVNGEVASAAKGATQIAQEGGRHAGQLQQFLKQMPDQLQRTVRSFDKQIAKHEGWIADPASKVPNFSQLRPEHQQNLLHHWRQDIARHQELRSIAQDVLKGMER